MDNKNNVKVSNRGGITFVGLLTILFIALKLCHVITWSWIWVLSPLWISFVLAIVLFVAVFGFILFVNK